MNIAVIPARGGSKRIPRKNIKSFDGLPVIAYAINAAKLSGVFEEVIVSTDDDEIADIAINFGATIPWKRSRKLADDFSSTVSVMQDAVKKLDVCNVDLEYVCCIYPATPLLQPNFITEGLNILKNGDWDYVFSGFRTSTHPQKYFQLGEYNEVEMLFPEFELTRTQDLGHFYRDAGQFYWGRKSAWTEGLPIFSSKSTIHEIPFESAIDIDTLEDWHYAEALFNLKKGKRLGVSDSASNEIFLGGYQ